MDAEGLSVAASPETADVLLAPESLPESLSEAVVSAWALRRRLMTLSAPLTGGADVRSLLDEPGGHDHGGHGHGGHEHDGHDHHSMMEVSGEPSSDGLVMEDLEFELGPLSAVLPGGVVAAVVLDGDVVGSCALRATLLSTGPSVPDPLPGCLGGGRCVP